MIARCRLLDRSGVSVHASADALKATIEGDDVLSGSLDLS